MLSIRNMEHGTWNMGTLRRHMIMVALSCCSCCTFSIAFCCCCDLKQLLLHLTLWRGLSENLGCDCCGTKVHKELLTKLILKWVFWQVASGWSWGPRIMGTLKRSCSSPQMMSGVFMFRESSSHKIGRKSKQPSHCTVSSSLGVNKILITLHFD